MFKAKFEWSDEEAYFNNLLMSAAAISGVIIGQGMGNYFAKAGRSRAIIISNMLAMVATSTTLFQIYGLMCAGRLLFGFCCGVIIFAG